MRPLAHLTIRVAWHDSQWNGAVCAQPTLNSFCATLDRIRESKTEGEEAFAERPFDSLSQDELPPCKAESGFFMSPRPWMRKFEHPYAKNRNCVETHGGLRPRTLEIPAWSAISVPFNWMLRRRQEAIDEKMLTPLAADEEAPFTTPWVFGRERQEALVDQVYGQLANEKSLAIFYTKEGHPLGDDLRRLIVGIGRIAKVGKREHYTLADDSLGHPLWDRVITHSIRPDAADGFLLPYHDYLRPTGHDAEDQRRRELLREIAVTPPATRIGDFSYGSELTDADVALSVLSRLLAAVRRIREHGIAAGPWQKREDWINEQLALAWRDRGAFPGTGSLLEALGMRLGTALFMELRASGALQPQDDPWPIVEQLFRGKKNPPHAAFAPDIAAASPTFLALSTPRRALLSLLSRFDLSPAQAERIWDEGERRQGFIQPASDEDIIANPYLIAELDLGGGEDAAVALQDIDRGLLPDKALAEAPSVPSPSGLGTPMDRRRVRCALVSVLREASEAGDSLLSLAETLERMKTLGGDNPIVVSTDWIEGNRDFLDQMIVRRTVTTNGENVKNVPALQLVDLAKREEDLAKVLKARSGREIPPPKADWKKLIIKSIEDAGQKVVLSSTRHKTALEEQAKALEAICSRRLSVLTGSAGTGKTSVIGGLVLCDQIRKEGLLLLAPTGKARVRLEGAAGVSNAMTVAQFLLTLKRYDTRRQRPLFKSSETWNSGKTVVIDEASMLTMDDLHAVLLAIDLGHVQRVILVGDPNQLPPIGVGRPFADLVSWLQEVGRKSDPDSQKIARALARLTVEVRSVANVTKGKEAERSDTLRLASWFTSAPPDGDADHVLSRLVLGEHLNDLEVVHWNKPQDLHDKLIQQFVKHLGLKDGADVDGFNKSFDFADEGWIPRDNPNGIENWQLLTPTRMHPHGVAELNRWIQSRFRARESKAAREYRGVALGDEAIVRNDKVIQLRNGIRENFDWETRKKGKQYVANGEIGCAAIGTPPFLNVHFAGRPMVSFGYRSWDFGENGAALELAYALTIHKAQGSQFRTVFVVLPKASRLLSRELVYTALTRSRSRLVLLVEGDDVGLLHDLSRPERSDTCRRNTNLFSSVLRERSGEPPYAEHLIHRTEKGHMVRSKSELIIANLLYRENIAYEYEKLLTGETAPGNVYPDFTFVDAAGDQVIWEHLGMMDNPDYVRGWNWKREWYTKNGFVPGKTLFTSEEKGGQGLDMQRLMGIATEIKRLT